jgi:hypothetical protein
VAGHSQPPARPSGTARSGQAALPDADRIHAYQQQLADDEARLAQIQKEAAATTRRRGAGGGPPRPEPANPAADDARRRESQSLFADNVSLSRRPAGQQPNGEGPSRSNAAGLGVPTPSAETQALVQALTQLASPRASVPVAGSNSTPTEPPPTTPPASATAPTKTKDENPAPGPRRRLLEGTVM